MPIAPPLGSKLMQLIGKAAEKVPLSVGPGRSIQKAMGKEPEGPTLKSIQDLAMPQDPAEAATDLVAPMAAIGKAGANLAGEVIGKGVKAASEAISGKTMQEAVEAGAKVLGKKTKYVAPEIASKKVKKVFHVSPHEFDKFDIEHVGSGTGATSEGHGFYQAEAEGVRDWYKALFEKRSYQGLKDEYGGMAPAVQNWIGAERTKSALEASAYRSNAIKHAEAEVEYLSDLIDRAGGRDDRFEMVENAEKILSEMKAGTFKAKTPKAYVYENLIPDEDDYLLWDKPLHEQPEKVKKALKQSGWNVDPPPSGASDTNLPYSDEPVGVRGYDVYDQYAEDFGSKKAAADALRIDGIRGVKYLDQHSREAGAGTYNYVMFDPDDIDIIKMLAQVLPLLGARATGKKAEAKQP